MLMLPELYSCFSVACTVHYSLIPQFLSFFFFTAVHCSDVGALSHPSYSFDSHSWKTRFKHQCAASNLQEPPSFFILFVFPGPAKHSEVEEADGQERLWNHKYTFSEKTHPNPQCILPWFLAGHLFFKVVPNIQMRLCDHQLCNMQS